MVGLTSVILGAAALTAAVRFVHHAGWQFYNINRCFHTFCSRLHIIWGVFAREWTYESFRNALTTLWQQLRPAPPDISDQLYLSVLEKLDHQNEVLLSDEAIPAARKRRWASGAVHLLAVMQHKIKVARAACKVLANISIPENDDAEMVIELGAVAEIASTMSRHLSDYQVCFYATAALWNCSRVNAGRELVGALTFDLLIHLLQQHKEEDHMTHTILGALTNLALTDYIARTLVHSTDVDLMDIVEKHAGCTNVLTSACAVLSNMAVADDVGEVIIEKDYLAMIIWILRRYHDHQKIVSHGVSALFNMCLCEHFAREFLMAEGVEVALQLCEQTDFMFNDANAGVFDSDGGSHQHMLADTLRAVQTERGEMTSSLHKAVVCHSDEVITHLLRSATQPDPLDQDGHTPLSLAIDNKNVYACYTLASCGALLRNAKALTLRGPGTPRRNMAIVWAKKGAEAFNRSHATLIRLLVSHSRLPKDICHLVKSYITPIHVVNAMCEDPNIIAKTQTSAFPFSFDYIMP